MEFSAAAISAGLLERERDVELLAARVDAALAGNGSTVALEGAAGIGKSALLRHAAAHAASVGMRVLGARGGELEQDFGYGIVRQLFDAPLAGIAREDRERVLSGAAGLAIAALSSAAADSGRGTADPGAVLHGLYWLCANLAAEHPLLIAVDDAHWADSASIAFLCYLARRVEGHPLLLLYATRVGEGASETLPATAGPGVVTGVVQPGLLSERASLELIARLLGQDTSEDFARACRVATGGNPFLLQELLRALHTDGIAPTSASCERVAVIAPGTISRSILARLGAPASQLAFATAVLGKTAQLHHAAAVAGLGLDVAGEAADALAAAAILRDASPLEFIHPIVRTAIYTEIPAAARAASHKQAGLLLQQEGVAPAELAPHLIASDPAGDPDVVTLLRAAAAAVRDRGATDAACTYLARALAEPPLREDRASVIYELGAAELAADHPTAVGHLREALAGSLGRELRSAAVMDLAAALIVSERAQEGLEMMEALCKTIEADGDVEASMQLEGKLACAAQLNPATSKRVRARLARHQGRLRGDSLGELLLLASLAFDTAHRPVAAEQAAGLAELALRDGRLLRLHSNYAPNFTLAAWTLVYADQLERAEELYTLRIEDAQRRGSLVAFAIATGCRCQVRFRQGRIDEAEAEAEARSCLEAAGDAWIIGRPMLIACVLDAMLERANPAACRAFLAEHGIEENLAAVTMASRLLYSRGHLRLASGDAAGALADFEQIRRREQQSGLETAAIPTRACAALAHAQLGHADEAHGLALEELERARVWGTPTALSFALRAAAIITGATDGLELHRQAAAVVERSPARYERARSLTEYGAALRRAGHPRDAREPLRQAVELADHCGAQRTAARARDELRASGARPRRTALSGTDSLTPSERRVTQLAAEGRTNRDIAQALFVTVRTVEGHLTQAYAKLAITSRDQLPPSIYPRTS